MAAPLPPSRYQYCDANGVPLAGGTIATYVVGTSTPKDTWADPDETSLNTNPVVLDSAGRCSMFGDGEYRLVLRDADGNLIWDTFATTIVSDAMQPVVSAATIDDAVALLGIQDLIDASVAIETTRAEAAEASLSSAISTETSRAEAAEAALSGAITAETARAEAAEAALSATIAAGGGRNFAETWTQNTQNNSVSITTSGGKVKVTVLSNPGSSIAGDTTYDGSGQILRDGIQIGGVGYGQSLRWGVNPLPPLDNPAAGAHTYTLNYYIDPAVQAASGESDWNASFSSTAFCYILVEEY